MSLSSMIAALSVFLLCTDNKVCSQNHGDTRLVQQDIRNASFTAGRLEIYMNSTWGSICADNFDMVDADVACRQLGYSGALETDTSFHTPYGRGMEGPIWLDEVECKNADLLHILSCSHVSVKEIDCDHFSDVAVKCIEQPRLVHPNDLDVRLVGGNFMSQGMLEVYCNGTWAPVCPHQGSKFGKDEGDAVCQQLGYTEAASFAKRLTSSEFVPEESPISTQELECTEGAHSIASCGGTCGTSEGESGDGLAASQTSCVFLECTHSVPYGSLRLSQGSHVTPGAMEGRLEVFYEGNWGTVCSHNFDLTAANISCQQLGFARALDYKISEEAGFGQGTIKSASLGGIQCSPDDHTLVQCANEIEERNCTHSEDVAVFCTNYFNIHPPTTGPGLKTKPLSPEVFIALIVGSCFLLIMCCTCLAVYCLHFSLVPYDTKKELSAHGLYFTEYEGSSLTLDETSLDQKLPEIVTTAPKGRELRQKDLEKSDSVSSENQGRKSRQKDLGKSDTDSSETPTRRKERYITMNTQSSSPKSPSVISQPTETKWPAPSPKHHSKFTIPPHSPLSSPKSSISRSHPTLKTAPVPPPLVVKRKAEQQRRQSMKDSASQSSPTAATKLQLAPAPHETVHDVPNTTSSSPVHGPLGPEVGSRTCHGARGTSKSGTCTRGRRLQPVRPAPYKGIRKVSQPELQTSEGTVNTDDTSAAVILRGDRDQAPTLDVAAAPSISATHTRNNHAHRVSFKLE